MTKIQLVKMFTLAKILNCVALLILLVAEEDYYKLLGVRKTASQNMIKKAYRSNDEHKRWDVLIFIIIAFISKYDRNITPLKI